MTCTSMCLRTSNDLLLQSASLHIYNSEISTALHSSTILVAAAQKAKDYRQRIRGTREGNSSKRALRMSMKIKLPPLTARAHGSLIAPLKKCAMRQSDFCSAHWHDYGCEHNLQSLNDGELLQNAIAPDFNNYL
ncbi:hypothetical protein Tco_0652450 [Tanacetum coccineum]|uniref:Uncharacterized protein n=1 Tax=Tanacetum coccineum TaxID=301880 RepID=A0ABQ4WXP3_9ASTR